MPAPDIPTMAWFEQNARMLSERESLTVTRGDIRRIAKQMRLDYIKEMPKWDEQAVPDVRILGILPDLTPRNALREITDNDKAAARRLGLLAM